MLALQIKTCRVVSRHLTLIGRSEKESKSPRRVCRARLTLFAMGCTIGIEKSSHYRFHSCVDSQKLILVPAFVSRIVMAITVVRAFALEIVTATIPTFSIAITVAAAVSWPDGLPIAAAEPSAVRSVVVWSTASAIETGAIGSSRAVWLRPTVSTTVIATAGPSSSAKAAAASSSTPRTRRSAFWSETVDVVVADTPAAIPTSEAASTAAADAAAEASSAESARSCGRTETGSDGARGDLLGVAATTEAAAETTGTPAADGATAFDVDEDAAIFDADAVGLLVCG